MVLGRSLTPQPGAQLKVRARPRNFDRSAVADDERIARRPVATADGDVAGGGLFEPRPLLDDDRVVMRAVVPDLVEVASAARDKPRPRAGYTHEIPAPGRTAHGQRATARHHRAVRDDQCVVRAARADNRVPLLGGKGRAVAGNLNARIAVFLAAEIVDLVAEIKSREFRIDAAQRRRDRILIRAVHDERMGEVGDATARPSVRSCVEVNRERTVAGIDAGAAGGKRSRRRQRPASASRDERSITGTWGGSTDPGCGQRRISTAADVGYVRRPGNCRRHASRRQRSEFSHCSFLSYVD